MSYDFIVVGAGLFGATLARELTDRGKKVLVVEKSGHLGGACYTEILEGVTVHRYGPHVFHTSDPEIWLYVQRFADWKPFMVRTKAIYGEKLFTLPFTLMTFNELWGVRTPYEAAKKLKEVCLKIENPKSIEQWALTKLGPEIYEKFIAGYTRKQWGRDPKDLPAAILKRLPIRLTMDDNYFSDRYQGIPAGGYTPMFERMLEGIDVKLNCDYLEHRAEFEGHGTVIYSGRVDAFFDYIYGPLEFRTARFDTKVVAGDFQGNPVIHYVEESYSFTRVVEHKHFETPNAERSPVTFEHPEECDRSGKPFYPINDEKNDLLYQKYMALKTGVIFGGRLGKYRYLDMHQVIGQAWALAAKLTG